MTTTTFDFFGVGSSSVAVTKSVDIPGVKVEIGKKSAERTKGTSALIAKLKESDPRLSAAIEASRVKIANVISDENTLKRLRLSKGLSQSDLAAMLKTKQPQIARIESGDQSPRIEFIKRLAVALDEDPVDIFKLLLANDKSKAGKDE